MRRIIFSLCFITSLALVLASCQKDFDFKDLFKEKEKNDTFYGAAVALGNGEARTFATLSHSGVPQETGVIFTDSALSGLPSENALYTLDFHPKATAATPFTHMVLGLSAHGHPLFPSGSIGPHFDARFYMMSQEEREAIPAPLSLGYPAGGGFDSVPSPGFLPNNYVMNFAVAKLGRHWNEAITTPGATVDHTMIYGTWNGQVTFLTLNVTLSALENGAKISTAYPQPKYVVKHGYYPKTYNAYKDGKGQHIISLSNFVWC